MEPFEKRANMTTGSIARGGKLAFDGERLSFGNHGIDRALSGDAEWSATLAEVERADVAKGSLSPKEMFSGGVRARLRIVTRDGEERLFVVSGAKELAEQINRAVRAAGAE